MHGFVTTTNGQGRFRFAVTPPTYPRQWLVIEPDRFLDSRTRWFGEGTGTGEAAIRRGERDLGDMRLARTGAISGLVLDDQGQPLPDVELETGPDRSTTYSRGARSGPDGRYEIPHARLGTYAVTAKKEGWLSATRESVTVEVERVTSRVVLILGVAPSIEGRITGPSGAPISDARVSGSPQSGDAPHTLTVTLDGYVTWRREQALARSALMLAAPPHRHFGPCFRSHSFTSRSASALATP